MPGHGLFNNSNSIKVMVVSVSTLINYTCIITYFNENTMQLSGPFATVLSINTPPPPPPRIQLCYLTLPLSPGHRAREYRANQFQSQNADVNTTTNTMMANTNQIDNLVYNHRNCFKFELIISTLFLRISIRMEASFVPLFRRSLFLNFARERSLRRLPYP